MSAGLRATLFLAATRYQGHDPQRRCRLGTDSVRPARVHLLAPLASAPTIRNSVGASSICPSAEWGA